ncbi:DUF4153 domain-containing protein [Chryseobacterium sp. MDT2-18]|uniref:DUF4153 domain-containing protein n=1 Tax=Chryseobacterium sp. MDT2-18 TaxID=1259136 RepID=UPI0027885E99|nr:DUF4153 domain-containing protein [Chryseobacterium sp. MDT2-18]MDQ0475717.1 preprotein translocase subunit YajC [Chryseobacterium sp. MDT2-18]
MVEKLKEVFGKTGAVIREYPMVLVMALIAAASAIFYNSNDYSRQDSFVYLKSGLVASLGISLMFALKMLSQRIGKELLLQVSGILFLIIFYFLLPPGEKQFTEVYAFLLLPTFLLSHLLVSFIAFIGKNRELNFWQYNKNLFINLFLTVVFTGILTAGIMLAILAVDHLFDFNFNSRYYSYTFSFLTIFGSCFIFLLFNEKGLFYLEKNGDYPVILKFFTQYVLVPLLLIYVVILYFYSAKILINWELPRGWVSYLILAYSVVGILAILLVHPLKEDSTKSWVRIFSKIFYYALAPLIVLLFIAIFTRILEYGYTEPRYFVLLLAIWLTAVVFYFIFIRKQTIKFVPVSLFAFGLFSLTFPYLNTFSVAKRSQKSELMKTLTENNLLENGKINFNKKVSDSLVIELSDKFEFLARRNEEEFLLPLLQKKDQAQLVKTTDDGNFNEVRNITRDQFKNVTYNLSDKKINPVSQNITLIAKDFNADLTGYHYLFKAYNYKDNFFEFDHNIVELKMPVSQFKSELFLVFNNQKVNLVPDLQKLFANFPNDGEIKVNQLFITKKIGNYEFKIMFDTLILIKSAGKEPQFLINSESVLILIKGN